MAFLKTSVLTQFSIKEIGKQYKGKFILDTALRCNGKFVVSVFYKPHLNDEDKAKGYSKYFGIYNNLIMDASGVENYEFAYVVLPDGRIMYSSYRWDCATYNDLIIDGGRDYIRTNVKDIKFFRVQNGSIIDVQSGIHL